MLAAPAPVAPPVIPPVTTGSPHEYVVPAGTMPLIPFDGVTVKVPLLHIVANIGVIEDMGFTVTVVVVVQPVPKV